MSTKSQKKAKEKSTSSSKKPASTPAAKKSESKTASRQATPFAGSKKSTDSKKKKSASSKKKKLEALKEDDEDEEEDASMSDRDSSANDDDDDDDMSDEEQSSPTKSLASKFDAAKDESEDDEDEEMGSGSDDEKSAASSADEESDEEEAKPQAKKKQKTSADSSKASAAAPAAAGAAAAAGAKSVELSPKDDKELQFHLKQLHRIMKKLRAFQMKRFVRKLKETKALNPPAEVIKNLDSEYEAVKHFNLDHLSLFAWRIYNLQLKGKKMNWTPAEKPTLDNVNSTESSAATPAPRHKELMSQLLTSAAAKKAVTEYLSSYVKKQKKDSKHKKKLEHIAEQAAKRKESEKKKKINDLKREKQQQEEKKAKRKAEKEAAKAAAKEGSDDDEDDESSEEDDESDKDEDMSESEASDVASSSSEDEDASRDEKRDAKVAARSEQKAAVKQKQKNTAKTAGEEDNSKPTLTEEEMANVKQLRLEKRAKRKEDKVKAREEKERKKAAGEESSSSGSDSSDGSDDDDVDKAAKKRAAKPSRVFSGLAVGKIVRGVVSGVEKFGLFIEFQYKKKERKGLAHISMVSDSYIKDLSGAFSVGDAVDAIVTKLDEKSGRISLGLKGSLFPEGKKPKPIQHLAQTARPLESLTDKKKGTDEDANAAPKMESVFMDTLAETKEGSGANVDPKLQTIKRFVNEVKASGSQKTKGKNRLGQRERRKLIGAVLGDQAEKPLLADNRASWKRKIAEKEQEKRSAGREEGMSDKSSVAAALSAVPTTPSAAGNNDPAYAGLNRRERRLAMHKDQAARGEAPKVFLDQLASGKFDRAASRPKPAADASKPAAPRPSSSSSSSHNAESSFHHKPAATKAASTPAAAPAAAPILDESMHPSWLAKQAQAAKLAAAPKGKKITFD